MRKNTILLIAMMVGLFFQSYGQKVIRASGNVSTKEFDISDFTSLDIANDIKAYVTFSDSEEKVVVKADDNLTQYVMVEKEGNTLKVKLKDHINIRGHETLIAYITTKEINNYRASGDSEIYLENNLNAKDVRVDLSGDSTFDGELETSSLEVRLRGDSEMKLSGKTGSLKALLRGDSKIQKYGFIIDDLDIELKGDSEAYLTVLKNMNVKVSGDSNLFYKGDASIASQRVTGDSEITKVD